jgi:signal transduction histidine kinase
MKLLTKTSIYYITFSVIAFVIGGFIFNQVIQKIFYHQIDQNMTTEKLLIIEQINYSDSLPDFRTVFGHLIEVTVFNEPKQKFGYIKTTDLFDKELGELIPHRHLIAEGTSIRNRGYIISIYQPLDTTQHLITAILGAMGLLFLFLMALLILVNYLSSKRVWAPFYQTLGNLNKYDISSDHPLELSVTSTHEFVLLNSALEQMSGKIRRDYFSLKEFNENASHELQTPLAIINSKLELLIQNERLSEDQMKLIQTISEATKRISKLNQGLLLISKIENNQFVQTESIDLQKVIGKNLEHFEELFQMKNITITKELAENVTVVMNRTLAEILISNLLTNSLKHNIEHGRITIHLDPDHLLISNTGQPLPVKPSALFERFRKSERGSDSAGLGLSIVREIITLYKMKIDYRVTDSVHSLEITFHP